MVQYDWLPELNVGSGPIWRRIVDVLAADVRLGRMAAGTRLPPHRELAYRLGVGVGTVSKAYVEAERRGLVTSRVGRGTFVAQRPAPSSRPSDARIDMALNIPPIAPALAHLDAALHALRLRGDVSAVADYSPTPGLQAVRAAGAEWLRAQGQLTRAQPGHLIQTNGGQHALMLACSSFARAGDTILCDMATYPGNRTIAEHGGWHLRGVPADGRGMDPEALDRAAAETGARLLILIPTLHNPTTITLDAQRRSDIVEIARARDLLIVEDDIYRVFGRPDDPLPFAELAPERTIHVTSLSKALAPGLRLGFVLPPEDRTIHQRLMLAAQASGYCPPAAGGLIFVQWMEDGTAPTLLGTVRAEMQQRHALARTMLGTAVAETPSDCSLHIWLPMSGEKAAHVAAYARQRHVEVTPPDAPFTDASAVDGLRLCLGTADELDRLSEGLRVVKAALDDDNSIMTRGII